jgi:hypothetical protein
MNELARRALGAAKAIQDEASAPWLPPDEGIPSRAEPVLAFSLVRGTRSYIERVVHQINTTYADACYDSCAVMLRRLIETLIIEAYEGHGIATQIQNANGDFLHLAELVSRTLGDTTWNLGRIAKAALPKLKDVGDRSAHDRRFNAHRSDIDKLIPDIRIVVQELTRLAGLK